MVLTNSSTREDVKMPKSEVNIKFWAREVKTCMDRVIDPTQSILFKHKKLDKHGVRLRFIKEAQQMLKNIEEDYTP